MSPNRISNLRIVLVDDHRDVRTYVGAFLRHLGAEVVIAENAMEGFEAVKTYHPDLVLSDITMHGRSGFDLLNDIRALGANGGGEIPVIAMTALTTRAERARILDAGFDAFLQKPFSPEALVNTILGLLDE